MDSIDEVSNCGGEGEGGGVITHQLLPFTKMYDCEDNHDDDDNDGVTDHEYRAEDRSIAGMGAGEVKIPTCNGVSDE